MAPDAVGGYACTYAWTEEAEVHQLKALGVGSTALLDLGLKALEERHEARRHILSSQRSAARVRHGMISWTSKLHMTVQRQCGFFETIHRCRDPPGMARARA